MSFCAEILRWLNTVFKKIENSRFISVFLENYYLLKNKKYLRPVSNVVLLMCRTH